MCIHLGQHILICDLIVVIIKARIASVNQSYVGLMCREKVIFDTRGNLKFPN
jgi:hypothetical protein